MDVKADAYVAGGVKANVLFFDKKPVRPDVPWTTDLWVYDFRVGQHLNDFRRVPPA